MTRTHATPLVGRELEKPLLVGTFERSAQQRSCQLVTIVGEPGVGKSRLCAELFALHRGAARARQLAPGALPALRGGDRLLGAGGDRQGGVRHPRVGLARRGGGEARAGGSARTIRTAPGSWPAWRRSSARRRSRPRRRSRSRPGGASGERWRPSGRRCSCSRICTGPTRRCSPSSSTWPTGREGVPLLLLCTARPELYERHPTWAPTLRNATADQPRPADRRGDRAAGRGAARAGGAAGGDAAGAARAGGRQPAVRGGVRAPARRPRRLGDESWRCPTRCRR